ncbi:unnamed protein product [Bursaphelenchus xylophilus]|uniref:Elongation factor Ts, mitochondrial n=1 Tax=Bursaphelenchus xylophilus TaxID=6326 RepID=A0A1I7RSQ5_BURXY|nr:unnamed protein product [Bursaphelenchus xylophilus]CAG9122837.1 unnamed protein product [Bursaphelenchus xylophilus]
MFRIASGLRSVRLVTSHLRFLSAAQPEQAQKVSKEALVKLRQKTGYSYVNCRKALLKYGEDNEVEAIQWLKELAAKEGWAKATKLSKRVASQGFVGFKSKQNVAAIVELNCETDFVARSDEFKKLVCEITESVLKAGEEIAEEKSPKEDKEIVVIPVDENLLRTEGNKTVKEAIAMLIGKLGENITLKKAEILVAKKGLDIYGHVHPNVDSSGVKIGQFVSVLTLGRDQSSSLPTDVLANQICQHIIGMKPTALGVPADENTQKRTEELVKREAEHVGEDDELNSFQEVQSPYIDEDETQLLRQAFLLHPQQTVHEYLKGHSAYVHWFVRAQVGGEQ